MAIEALVLNEPLVHLVARNPVEMQEAREGLIAWLKAKIAEVAAEKRDYEESLEAAIKHKWGVSGMRKAISSAFYRQEFYEKTCEVVEAGFTIIPEFPIDVFAIRVRRDRPDGGSTETGWGKARPDDEPCEILPVGAGDYVSPIPKVSHHKELRGEGDKTYSVDVAVPTALQAVVFPIRSARVEVMNATAEAMALKVFDEIGICPQSRKPDPLIIGRILLPGSDKMVNFLIAWHLSLREL